ncbi:MAG: hypothetical protein KDA85_22815, partial [Planctomycetaceae bacterium]|nr:hypothetical protein [Planctomycetaceae bacterium]
NRRDPGNGLGSGPNQMGLPPGSQVCNLLMMDGAVRAVSSDVSLDIMQKLATPDGGEVVGNF